MNPAPRVLVVDDDEAARYAVARVLSGAGFSPLEAGNGADALRRAREGPDAVVLDLRLPDLDGFEVCRRLRADPVTAGLPIVHLTATYGSPDAWAAALDSGADVYLTHPVEPVVLIATLRSLLRGRESDRALKASERHWRAVFESTLDAILIADDAGRYVDANPAASTLLGLSREEILARGVAGVTPPESAKEVAGAWKAFLHDGQSQGTITLVRGDGTRVEAEFAARAHFVPGRHVSVLRDVTDRRRAEKALADSRRLLEDAQQIARLGSFEWNVGTGELAWSAELYRIFGLPAETRLTHAAFLEQVHPEDRAFVAALSEAARKDGQPFEYYGRIVRPGGEVRHLHARGEPVRGDDGTVARVTGVARDITESARSEDARRRLTDRLLRVQEEERRRLARELHDEVGQALTALKLLLEAGTRGDGTPQLAEAAGVVEDLIAKVRDLSLRLRPPVLEDFGLAAALRWHLERYTRHTGIAVRLLGRPASRFPPEVELAAFRVVQEALTNVARHSGASRAQVELRWEAGVLTASVVDSGRGCDPRRVLQATSTGLPGLRERVEMLGGRFEVSSAPGGGMRVTARLPAVRRPRAPAVQGGGTRPGKGRRPPKRVRK